MDLQAARRIAFVSSYAPRQCGIATFTSDLISHVRLAGASECEAEVIAMHSGDALEYGEPVRLCIRRDVAYDYVAAARYINSSDIDVVSVQHESGLFGGEGGAYINLLLGRLNKPVVTTLHTVLEEPSREYFDSLIDVCKASDRVVVMNRRGIRMLSDIYGVPHWKIELIPHGIPDLPFTHSGSHKQRLGMAGRKTILTFGLLSVNKGIEVMLKALPSIVEAHPSVLYVILGATHPEVLRYEGESYRRRLEEMVRELRLQDNVVFHNRFVSSVELYQFLGAADIYVTPYLSRNQLTSGTLAFAVGTGRVVVSTPYWAAQELLAQDRGRLVEFGDSESMSRSITEILSNDSLSRDIRRRAYQYGRSRTWPKIGQAYWNLFESLVPSTSMLHEMDTVLKTGSLIRQYG